MIDDQYVRFARRRDARTSGRDHPAHGESARPTATLNRLPTVAASAAWSSTLAVPSYFAWRMAS